MRPHSPIPETSEERGFALLTVIVIVMALTILGLSLFSLSGFEARFFRPTMDQAQAMQSARGGVDWARFVLQSTDSINMVRIAAHPPGVPDVVVRKGGIDIESADDSTGGVFRPPYLPVWVRVVGEEGSQQGAVLAKFHPSPGQDLYKRLITVMDRIVVMPSTTGEFGNTVLNGNILMNTVRIEDYGGTEVTAALHGNNCISQASLPRPEQDLKGAWWQEKKAEAANLPITGAQISLGASGSDPAIYITDSRIETSNRRWSAILDNDDKCTINARGVSIWMFPEGLRCEKQLRIHKVGPEKATVILVGRPGVTLDPGGNMLEDDVGFALLGGVDFDPGVNVFIISTGCVEIEHQLDAEYSASNSNYLSIYADWVRLKGPKDSASGDDMTLQHGLYCTTILDQDEKDHLVDQLIEQDLLPNSRFARKRLEFISGSWLESSITVGN